MTEEEKKIYDEKKRIAAKAYQERKANARKIVAKYFENPESAKVPAEVKDAVLYLAGATTRISGGGRTGIASELRDMLVARKKVSAIELFQKFEYGRPSMEQKIRYFIKNSEPAERIWIAFEDGNYVLKGTGENPPKGWTGYVPPVKAEEEDL